MLSLACKRNERIILSRGGQVIATIMVDDCDRLRARLAIQANLDVDINREEIHVAKFGDVQELRPHWRTNGTKLV